MPILENEPDRRGRPICPKRAQSILPGDGVALMEDSMIHADCVSRPPFWVVLPRSRRPKDSPSPPGHKRSGGKRVRLGEGLRADEAQEGRSIGSEEQGPED